jgi:hypothetical protein
MDKAMLFRVLSAANYMTIRPLLDLACLWCTFQLSGKSAEEVRTRTSTHAVRMHACDILVERLFLL